ncbi:hypothetical protein JG687_00015935 [Phytophthora cactorum]|uniref:Uncharacterized protein n=1 Tax=Phytophthora cactorum TaxID=29920 RepID=A0A8T1TWI7_9STRA|nr:hypothetical protein JG687_00015935 [Phytophthora cactorum]
MNCEMGSLSAASADCSIHLKWLGAIHDWLASFVLNISIIMSISNYIIFWG